MPLRSLVPRIEKKKFENYFRQPSTRLFRQRSERETPLDPELISRCLRLAFDCIHNDSGVICSVVRSPYWLLDGILRLVVISIVVVSLSICLLISLIFVVIQLTQFDRTAARHLVFVNASNSNFIFEPSLLRDNIQ
jgi:hypothetical protein